MGMLLVVAVLVALAMIVWLFTLAVRSEDKQSPHRWLVVLPIVALAGWLVEQLIMGH